MKSFKQFLLIENKEELVNQLNSLVKKEKLDTEILSSYLPLVEEIYVRFKGSNLYQFLSTVLKDLILTENGKKAKVKSISKKEFKDLLMELEHFYAYDFIKKHYKLVAKKPYDQVLRELKEKEEEWKKTNPQFIPPDGKKILTFPDGYFWVDLEKSKCSMESQAMGHCGTTSEDETLLSLRKEVKKGNKTYHEPHLTFSLRDDGYLTQMKGKENKKPSKKYHKYIIELLDHTRIKGIKGGEYRLETNFNILDLPKEQWKKIYTKNKNMLGDFTEEYHEVVKKMVERDLTKEEQLEYVKKDPHFIQLFVDADEDVQLAAVEKDERALQSIINAGIKPSEAVQLAAVKKYWWVITYILDAGLKPPESVQLAAVKKNENVIEILIRDKIKLSEAVQLAAVKKNWWAITYILGAGYEPSEDVQLAAVKGDWEAMFDIIKAGVEPSEKVISVAIDKGWYLPPKKIYDALSPELKKNVDETQIAELKKHKFVITKILNAGLEPSEAVQLAAVEQDERKITKILNAGYTPPESVQLAAVKKREVLITDILDAGVEPSVAVQLAAVEKNEKLIVYIIRAGYEPSDRVTSTAIDKGWYFPPKKFYDTLSSKLKENVVENQVAAAGNDKLALRYIFNAGIEPSEKVQLAALKKYPLAIRYIRNVKDSAIKYMIDNYSKDEILDVLSNRFLFKETKPKLQDAFDKKYK